MRQHVRRGEREHQTKHDREPDRALQRPERAQLALVRAECDESTERVARRGADRARQTDQPLAIHVGRQLRSGGVPGQRGEGQRVGHERRLDDVPGQRRAHDVGPFERVEREEHDVGRRGLFDLLGESVVDRVRGHERAPRRFGRRGAQRHGHGDEQPAPLLVQPRTVRRLARQRVADEGATREIDVELARVVGAGDQDAALVGDQHPRRAQQPAVLLGLVEYVATLGGVQQAFAELRYLRAQGAHPRERRGPSRQERLDPAPYAGDGVANRLVRRAVRHERREPQRDAQRAHDHQRGRDEYLGPEAEPRGSPSHRVFSVALEASQVTVALPKPPGAAGASRARREAGLSAPAV